MALSPSAGRDMVGHRTRLGFKREGSTVGIKALECGPKFLCGSAQCIAAGESWASWSHQYDRHGAIGLIDE
jgi:hypothetical protein